MVTENDRFVRNGQKLRVNLFFKFSSNLDNHLVFGFFSETKSTPPYKRVRIYDFEKP